MKLKNIVKAIIAESPLSNLGDDFLTKKVDRNIMHTHTYQVWTKAGTKGPEPVYLGGLSVKEDTIKYAKAYFETHKYPHQPGFTVYVLRWNDDKVIKRYEIQ